MIRKSLITLLTSMLLVGCTPTPVEGGSYSDNARYGYRYAPIVPQNIEDSFKGTVMIQVYKKGGLGMGAGAGFFVDTNLIMTNCHVACDTTMIAVKMHDRLRYWDAEIVASDKVGDVALIRIKDWENFTKQNKDYRVLEFATNEYTPGTEAYSIGNPLALNFTLSRGIIAAEDLFPVPGEPKFYLQTDMAIAEGSSGGPLFNGRGYVIGMNTAMKYEEGHGYPYGLAIDAKLLVKMKGDLLKYGLVKYPYLGLGVDLDLDTGHLKVVEIKAAAQEDIRKHLEIGDLLLSVETESTGFKPFPVWTAEDLISRLTIMDVGDTMRINVLRKGLVNSFDIKMEKYNTSASFTG